VKLEKSYQQMLGQQLPQQAATLTFGEPLGAHPTQTKSCRNALTTNRCARVPMSQVELVNGVRNQMSVSIGLPYTDQGELLRLAIRSVLAQSLKDWELILIGDCPDAETLSVARSFNDPRIRFYENPSRMGLAATLNRISKLANHPLIARMDGDDIMHPQRLELQKRRFVENPDLDVVGSHAYLIDERSMLAGGFVEPDLPTSGSGFLRSNAFTHPTVMGRREWFLANPYNEDLLRSEDKELWLRTWSHSNFEKMPERLMFYRRPRNLSAQRMRRDEAYNRQILNLYSFYRGHTAMSRVRLALASHAKEIALGLIGSSGLAPALFNTKWEEINSEEFAAANRVLSETRVRPEFSNRPLKVVAATVTYANRYELVKRTVDAALNAGAAKAIVVDNGSGEPSRSLLRSWSRTDDRIQLVALRENTGSANGFAEALRTALETDAEYVWLLDDDNECEPSALRELVGTHDKLMQPGSSGPIGVCAVRPSNASHLAVVKGSPAADAYPPSGSFMYFDLWHRIRLAVSRSCVAVHHPVASNGITAVPYAPYGGLFASSISFHAVGLPNLMLGLYEDDTEYTARFWSEGGFLALAHNAVVNDIDAKWSEQEGQTGLAGLLHASDMKRIYFAVRNRVSFDLQRSGGVQKRLRFKLNEFVFRSFLLTSAIKYGKLSQAREIYDGLRAGLKNDFTRSFSNTEQFVSTDSDAYERENSRMG
jgi:glycosyltransferase involved in cell wall biosynthesis